jgi:hypothetical protein
MTGVCSTQKLADALGVSYQSVKKVLDGSSRAFNVENHHRAADFLNISARWLALGEGLARDPEPRTLHDGDNSFTQQDFRQQSDSARTGELLHIFRSLPPARQKTAVAILVVLAAEPS